MEDLTIEVQNRELNKQHQKASLNAFMNYPHENESSYILEVIDDCGSEFFELK